MLHRLSSFFRTRYTRTEGSHLQMLKQVPLSWIEWTINMPSSSTTLRKTSRYEILMRHSWKTASMITLFTGKSILILLALTMSVWNCPFVHPKTLISLCSSHLVQKLVMSSTTKFKTKRNAHWPRIGLKLIHRGALSCMPLLTTRWVTDANYCNWTRHCNRAFKSVKCMSTSASESKVHPALCKIKKWFATSRGLTAK